LIETGESKPGVQGLRLAGQGGARPGSRFYLFISTLDNPATSPATGTGCAILYSEAEIAIAEEIKAAHFKDAPAPMSDRMMSPIGPERAFRLSVRNCIVARLGFP